MAEKKNNSNFRANVSALKTCKCIGTKHRSTLHDVVSAEHERDAYDDG